MTRPQTQTMRQGPRPLALHLALATMNCAGSSVALPLLRNASLHWKEPLQQAAADLATAIAKTDTEALRQAVERESLERLDRFLTGVEHYRHHPYCRTADTSSPVWTDGNATLRRFGDDGPAVLLVASLINRSYILDLGPKRSFARWLAAQGFRCYLLDWGAPGERECRFSIDDYIAGPLQAGFDAVRTDAGGKVSILGYCMGGLLALALALRNRADVASLVLLATPWDFHAEDPGQARALGTAMRGFEPQLQTFGSLPTDTLQYLFCLLDPFLGIRKFTAFAGLDQNSEAARRFVALEDWLNDGVPLAAPVARACAFDWYGKNSPARGDWRVCGAPIRPEDWDAPAYVVIPAADRIVPPASAEGLARALPNATVKRPRAGHIGMIAGRGVTRSIWSPLANWLSKNCAAEP
ncbi:MAG: alpha/beta fold hydrolase [Rhodospirillaceae bacterium]|nr:alpha/beta fold hydrolase [Rhodospirillaceae bacterium]